MSIKQITIAVVSAFIGTAAMACPDHQQDAWSKFQDAGKYAAAPHGRAEVIADLEVYRKSGLAELDSVDSPEVFSADYRAAQVRYQAMRSSPDFTALVASIARQRGEAVATASGGSATAVQ